jgi:type IV pilus assembly protein PilX
MADRYANTPARQHGAALVVSLMLLLVLTILGITGMYTTTLEEKMAGNMRDREIAFEAAERTLRYAERWLDGNVVALGAFDDDGSDGLYNYETPKIWTKVDWAGTDSSNGNKARSNDDISGTSAQGRFIVEHLQTVAGGNDVNLNNYGQDIGGADLEVFRITARGSGGADGAAVYLQTTYAKAL